MPTTKVLVGLKPTTYAYVPDAYVATSHAATISRSASAKFRVHKGMDGARWTMVQKRNTQRLQTDLETRIVRVETPVSQCKYSDTGASESQNGVGISPHVAAPVVSVEHEQTSIRSLIGIPFIVRSHQEVESRLGDETQNVTKRPKNESTAKKPGSVRGLLRINPNLLDKKTVCGVARNKQEVEDLGDINESDWPSISAHHTRDEDGVAENSESDGKSWSTVLRTVTLPKPVKKVCIWFLDACVPAVLSMP